MWLIATQDTVWNKNRVNSVTMILWAETLYSHQPSNIPRRWLFRGWVTLCGHCLFGSGSGRSSERVSATTLSLCRSGPFHRHDPVSFAMVFLVHSEHLFLTTKQVAMVLAPLALLCLSGDHRFHAYALATEPHSRLGAFSWDRRPLIERKSRVPSSVQSFLDSALWLLVIFFMRCK